MSYSYTTVSYVITILYTTVSYVIPDIAIIDVLDEDDIADNGV
jgi:hypothetical protein